MIGWLGLTTLAITYLKPVVGAVTAPGVQGNSITGLGSTTPEEIVVSSLRDHRFPYHDREGLVRISRT